MNLKGSNRSTDRSKPELIWRRYCGRSDPDFIELVDDYLDRLNRFYILLYNRANAGKGQHNIRIPQNG
jgi:hypothetical protein